MNNMIALNDRVEFARIFASALHADQGQTYDGAPYSKHLEDVVQVLLRFDVIDKDMLAAAYLHDVIEDTGLPQDVIFKLFDNGVGMLVTGVTDEPGSNRRERKAKTYPKIKSTPGALQLKLADRIANVEHGLKTGNVRMQKMYRKEFDDFSQHLRVIGELEPMWGHLQALHLKTGGTVI